MNTITSLIVHEYNTHIYMSQRGCLGLNRGYKFLPFPWWPNRSCSYK